MLPFENIPARDFLKGLSKLVGRRPKAILVVSGHWDTREPMVSTTPTNPTIYDFYGFPRELYQLKYDAAGAPEVARRAKQLLLEAGFKASEDPRRGLDHGAWVPLWLAYPEVDVPVFQVSLQSNRDAAYHFKLGRALSPLKDEGVLIFASGTTTHNLREIIFDRTPSWAKAFDEWLYDCLTHQRYDDVVDFMNKGPYAKKNHPTPDHFLPLIVALGAAGEGAISEAVHRSFHGSFSMTSYVFKPAVQTGSEL